MEKLTFENYRKLAPWVQLANYCEYNANIITMLMWSNLYDVYFEIHKHYAIAYEIFNSRDLIWMMPYCDQMFRKEAIAYMQTYSVSHKVPFEIHSMSQKSKDEVMLAYPNQFVFWECGEARDYIYDRVQQQTLQGKKMQKRRNHYHAFEKSFKDNFYYKRMEKADIDSVRACYAKWMDQKSLNAEMLAEKQGIFDLLAHLDTLDILAGCLYVNDTLEAFHISSLLSKDTVQIHVEKANREIRGCYIAIQVKFLETLDENIRFINREDDMGLPSLRSAKQNMQPLNRSKKFGCRFEKNRCTLATTLDVENMQRLWSSRFEEENDASTAFYFQHLFEIEGAYVLKSETMLLSMLHIRHHTVQLADESIELPFIIGVATEQRFEHCGYMKQLLLFVLNILSKTYPFALIQAYDPDLYLPFGFEMLYQKYLVKLDKNLYQNARGSFEKGACSNTLLCLYKAYTHNKVGYCKRSIVDFDQLISYSVMIGCSIALFKNSEYQGYIIYEESDKILEVLECIYLNENAKVEMLSLLCKEEKEIFVQGIKEDFYLGKKKMIPSMMVKQLQSMSYPKEHLFIHEDF